MAARGGRRTGSGRKAKAIRELQRSFAAEILSDTIEKNSFRKLLNSKDERVSLDALKYLADQKHGKASQAVEHSGPGGAPIEIDTGDPKVNEARILALLQKAGGKDGDGSS